MGAVVQEAWGQTLFLASETFKAVVYGDTSGKSLPSIGFRTLNEVAIFGFVCLFNVIAVAVLEATVFNLVKTLFLKNKKNSQGFTFSCRECTFYALSLFCSIRVYGQERWFWDLKYLWTLMESFDVKPAQKFLYLCELSWYVCGIVRLVIEPRKKDFKQMITHHVSTIILIGVSYHVHMFRIGVMIYNVHNISDPFLHAAKVFKYCGSELGATLFFVPFALSFFVSRLIMYPMVCYETIFYGPGYHRKTGMYTHEYWSCGLLVLLIPIHVFWFSLIAKIAVKSIKGSLLKDDPRSDSEDSDEEEYEETKTQRKKRA